MPELAILEKDKIVKKWQSVKDKEIADKVWFNFDKWRNNRNMAFANFKNRTLFEYLNDNQARFNNYREKPSWKEEWQANISDITTHAKVMAIVANVLSVRMKPEFYSTFKKDMFAEVKAKILQSIYEYIDKNEINGDLFDLFVTLKTARDGTCITFEGYKKTKLYEGIDAQIIPLEDFYPSNVAEYDIQKQYKAVWRSIVSVDDFDDYYSDYYNYDKVKEIMSVDGEEKTIFKISNDIGQDQIEILRYFDLLNDEFFVTANSILIIKPDGIQNKLSKRRNDKKMGFSKTVYEPFDDFFYGRSMVDLMSDNQDGIDFLFNAMFDKEILAVLRPILVGGQNSLSNDYMYPGKVTSVLDTTQIKELAITSPDSVAFQVLQELQNRQQFVTTGTAQSGVSEGGKTATEVERAEEAARRILTLFNVLLADGIKQRAMLRADIIIKYYLNKKGLEPLILENVKLISGKTGTQIIKVKPKDKLAPVVNEYGMSNELMEENTNIPTESEIHEITPNFFKDYKYGISVRTPSVVEYSNALQKAFDREFFTTAIQLPDLFDKKAIAKRYSESMNQNWEELKSNEEQPQQMGMEDVGGGNQELKDIAGMEELPSLKSQLTNV